MDDAKIVRERISVIMLSNFNIPHYRQACAEAGALHFFDKSSEFEILPSVVRHLLDDMVNTGRNPKV